MMSNMNVSTSFADRKTDVPSRGADLDKTKGQILKFRSIKTQTNFLEGYDESSLVFSIWAC